jgi:hypothetical protein
VAAPADIDAIVRYGFGRRLSVAGVFEIGDMAGLVLFFMSEWRPDCWKQSTSGDFFRRSKWPWIRSRKSAPCLKKHDERRHPDLGKATAHTILTPFRRAEGGLDASANRRFQLRAQLPPGLTGARHAAARRGL